MRKDFLHCQYILVLRWPLPSFSHPYPQSAPKILSSAGIQARRLHVLWRNMQLLVPTVKHDVLRPEHDVTVNLNLRTTVALYPAKARTLRYFGKCDHVARNHRSVIVAEGHAESRKLSIARVGVAAGLGVAFRALNLAVVCCGDLRVNQNQRSAGVYVRRVSVYGL